MKHIKIEVLANEHQQEELIALLDDYHATGFEQTDEKLFAFFDEHRFEKETIFQILHGYSFTTEEMEERNWNEEWEKNFEPVVVDDFVTVRADFHPAVAEIKHEIIITPKMSFGTGHHATTYMMLQQMRELDFTNKTVFDFGTGTGILGILAEKLGAKKIVAIDVDDWSIENAKENIERNNCSNIEVSLSSNIPAQKFDVILANINRNVILNYMRHLTEALPFEGVVLFSGLMAADEAEIAYLAERCGLAFQRKTERQGWLSLLFTNASQSQVNLT